MVSAALLDILMHNCNYFQKLYRDRGHVKDTSRHEWVENLSGENALINYRLNAQNSINISFRLCRKNAAILTVHSCQGIIV